MSTTQDFLNSKAWCYKMDEFVFKKADNDQDGYISQEDRECSKARFIEYVQKHQKVLEANKVASEKYMSVFGTESDRIGKDDFLKKLAELAAADQERIKRGEEPILVGNAGTLFDLMNGDKDGFVTLEDFKPLYVAIGWDAEAAEGAFKVMDKNNSGKIVREETTKSGYDFWYNVAEQQQ